MRMILVAAAMALPIGYLSIDSTQQPGNISYCYEDEFKAEL
jgi:hypothetical protein